MKMLTMAAVVVALGATSGVASAQARAFRAERPDVGSAHEARAARAAVQPRSEVVRGRSEAAERAIVRAQVTGQRERAVAPRVMPEQGATAMARAHGAVERQPMPIAKGDGTSSAAPVTTPPGASHAPQRVRCAEGQPSCGAVSREGVLPAPASAAPAASEEQLRAMIKRVREAIADRVSRYVQPAPGA